MRITFKYLSLSLLSWLFLWTTNLDLESYFYKFTIPTTIFIAKKKANTIRYFQDFYRVHYSRGSILMDINEGLRRDMLAARVKNAEYNANIAHINELERRIKFVNPAVKTIATTNALFTNSAFLNKGIYIPVGATDGVKVGDTVIYDKYLIGVIHKVDSKHSFAATTYSNNVKVPVIVGKDAVFAVTYGVDGEYMYLKYQNPEAVQRNDIVITSGKGGLFPPNLIVGVVNNNVRLSVKRVLDFEKTHFVQIARYELNRSNID